MHPVFTQMFAYMVVLIMAVGLVGVLQKQFFFAWIKARLSFGKLVLVRVHTAKKKYYRAGKIKDGDLTYKQGSDELRYCLPNESFFYMAHGCMSIDVNQDRGVVLYPDYTKIQSGYDPIKWANLLKRALYTPPILNKKEQLIVLLCGLTLVVSIGGIIFLKFFIEETVRQQVAAQVGPIVSKIESIGQGMITGSSSL